MMTTNLEIDRKARTLGTITFAVIAIYTLLFSPAYIHHGAVGAAIAAGVLASVCVIPSVITAVLSRCVGYSNWAVLTVLYGVSLDMLARLFHWTVA